MKELLSGVSTALNFFRPTYEDHFIKLIRKLMSFSPFGV